MIDYPSTRSGLLGQEVATLLGDSNEIQAQIKVALEDALSTDSTDMCAKNMKKFIFLLDSPFAPADQAHFAELLNAIGHKEDDKTRKELRNDIVSRLLNIKDADNISRAKELSIIFVGLIVNSLVRYYNLYMVSAVTFVFLSTVMQFISLTASLVIGYQLTTMLNGWVNHNCFARERREIKFASIVGSLHFENYFVSAFGRSFYDSLKVTKYKFEDGYSAEGALVFSEFKDVIAARKSIFYKYSYHQKHLSLSDFVQKRLVHNKVSANMIEEFATLNLPNGMRDYRILESTGAEKIWQNVSSSVLTRENFSNLLAECKNNAGNKIFICNLYDSCMQFNTNVGLEELYVLSELVNQCLFPGYVSHLDRDSKVNDDEKKEVVADPIPKVQESSFAEKLGIFKKKGAISIGRLIFSLDYLHKYQKNFDAAGDVRISNTSKDLLIPDENSPYSTELDLNALFGVFKELNRRYSVAINTKDSSKSQGDPIKVEVINGNSDSFKQFFVNGFKGFFTADPTKKQDNEGKLTYVKTASTCVSGLVVYGLSNTFVINFALTGMSCYILYESSCIVVGRKYIDSLVGKIVSSGLGYVSNKEAS